MAKKASISEAHIQNTCSEMLAHDDWRRVRTDLKHLRGLGVQEPGMADDLYIRYTPDIMACRGFSRQKAEALRVELGDCSSQTMWVEWKRRTGKAAEHQKTWIEHERKIGALVLLAGVDFEASIEGFKAFYMASGLNRRILP